jgi:hypothetical protein
MFTLEHPKAWHFKLISIFSFISVVTELMSYYLMDDKDLNEIRLEGNRLRIGIAWYVASGIPLLFSTYDFYQQRKFAYFYQWLIQASLSVGGIMWIEAFIKPENQTFRIFTGILLGLCVFLKTNAMVYHIRFVQMRNNINLYTNGPNWYWIIDGYVPPNSMLLRIETLTLIIGGFLSQLVLFMYEYIIDVPTGIDPHLFVVPAYVSMGYLLLSTMRDYLMYRQTVRKSALFRRFFLFVVCATIVCLWTQARVTNSVLLRHMVVALESFVLMFGVLLPILFIAILKNRVFITFAENHVTKQKKGE